MKKDGYKLTRSWFDFAYENKEAKAIHTALFMWCVEVNNKCGWKDEFGLPTSHAMEVLSIANKKTYYDTLKDLETFGFIKIVQESKNQFMACIVSICHEVAEVKNTTALSSAMQQQHHQQCSSTINSTPSGIVPIDKQINIQPINKEGGEILKPSSPAWWVSANKEAVTQKVMLYNNAYPIPFLQTFIDYYCQPHIHGGILINHEMKFDIESKLRKWYSDPKTKEQFPQPKQGRKVL